MIPPDTSIWIDHLSRPDEQMVELLNGGEVLLHPFVVGEICFGQPAQQTECNVVPVRGE